MQSDHSQTERFVSFQDAEELFALFVRNANSVGYAARTQRSPLLSHQALALDEAAVADDQPPGEAPPAEPGGADSPSGQILLLTRKKEPSTVRPPKPGGIAEVVQLSDYTPEPRGPGPDTQRKEARLVVPRVADVEPQPAPPPERSEDGQIPPRKLDKILTELAVLHRYGYRHDVVRRLEELLQKYPEDLLLLRRIAELHLQLGNREEAMECLFKLAAGLFERRNVHGMREALEQVLVLDPKNQRAYKLLGLLQARPATGS